VAVSWRGEPLLNSIFTPENGRMRFNPLVSPTTWCAATPDSVPDVKSIGFEPAAPQHHSHARPRRLWHEHPEELAWDAELPSDGSSTSCCPIQAWPPMGGQGDQGSWNQRPIESAANSLEQAFCGRGVHAKRRFSTCAAQQAEADSLMQAGPCKLPSLRQRSHRPAAGVGRSQEFR